MTVLGPARRPLPKPSPPPLRVVEAAEARPAVVPGENIRSVLSAAGGVISPLASGGQLVALMSRIRLLAGLAAPVGRVLAIPIVATVLRGAERALPWVKLGVLGFDAFAAYQTVTNPEASQARKRVVVARAVFSALGTGLAFVPRWGALASKIPSYLSLGADLWIKKMNIRGQA